MPSISTRTSADRKFKQGVSSLWTLGLALLLVGLLGYPGRAQDPGTPGAPPLASRSGHVVSLQAPHTVVQRQSAEVVIRVHNGQGEPLDGVPVVFQVVPIWEGNAAVFPPQTLTHNGTARAQVRADLIGVVPQHDPGRLW